MGQQKWGLGAVTPAGSGAKLPVKDRGGKAPEAEDIFVKICYFVAVLTRTHDYTNQFNNYEHVYSPQKADTE